MRPIHVFGGIREMDDPVLDFDMDLPADYEKAVQLYFNNKASI